MPFSEILRRARKSNILPPIVPNVGSLLAKTIPLATRLEQILKNLMEPAIIHHAKML
jgi:hypothetical protein